MIRPTAPSGMTRPAAPRPPSVSNAGIRRPAAPGSASYRPAPPNPAMLGSRYEGGYDHRRWRDHRGIDWSGYDRAMMNMGLGQVGNVYYGLPDYYGVGGSTTVVEDVYDEPAAAPNVVVEDVYDDDNADMGCEGQMLGETSSGTAFGHEVSISAAPGPVKCTFGWDKRNRNRQRPVGYYPRGFGAAFHGDASFGWMMPTLPGAISESPLRGRFAPDVDLTGSMGLGGMG